MAEEYVTEAPESLPILVSEYPYRTYALIANAFYPPQKPKSQIHSTAVVHPTAKIGEGCNIGPLAVIGENVELGQNVAIGSHTVIGSGVVIGDGSEIGPHVSIEYAIMSNVTCDHQITIITNFCI